MSTVLTLMVGLGVLFQETDTRPRLDDVAYLREMLQDRQHPRMQHQAALLLVQNQSPASEALVRQGLRQTETVEVFVALAAAVRLCHDRRFLDELLAGLASSRPAARQQAAETLAVLVDASLVLRLQGVAEDAQAEIAVRQAALWTLGSSGRKSAAKVLLDQLSSDQEALRRTAMEALTELTGQTFEDTAHWRAWWIGHKDVAGEAWLQERLIYQSSRARRLKGELEKTKSEVVRLHEQLYTRLPAADRLGQIQVLVDHEDPAVRGLAVTWCAELLSGADAVGQRTLSDIVLRLSRDSGVEVQRAAVLLLGRVHDPRAFERLRVLLHHGHAPVRAAAARGLAQQAKSPGPGSAGRDRRSLQREVVPALQKALEDSAMEVVIEAAEDLGSLGLPEAVPVLAALLRHPSEPVRQTAAQALERVADAGIVDEVLSALDDAAVTVRFSLVGAVGHAAGDGRSLSEPLRNRVIARMEDRLLRDTDPGVRSRAATVLGECGPASVLQPLWRRVLAAEDNRVQEKALAAFMNIIARSASMDLLNEWDRNLTDAKQGVYRVQLLTTVVDAWKKNAETKPLVVPTMEMLVPAQLEQGKWLAAFPFVRELLTQPGSDGDMQKRLRWLLIVGEQALKEGNRAEALRAVREAQSFLPRSPKLTIEFEKLEKQAQTKKN